MSKSHIERRWYAEYRYAWIKESIEVFDYINRRHICRKFGVSQPQASMDLQEVNRRYPELMAYNLHTKQYELRNKGETK